MKNVLVVVLTVLTVCFTQTAFGAARIKDIVSVQGVRDNQLIGYGLVVGLQGTGDSLRNSPFTEQSLRVMLERLGAKYKRETSQTKNVAAVMITANLPPFIRKGSRIDINVSSLGDASSLVGGTLVLTPLKGADGLVYAVAQGPLTVTGFVSKGLAESVTQGVPTSGRIPNGAIVEREVTGQFYKATVIVLELRNPDFRTSILIAKAINKYAKRRFGRVVAWARDLRNVHLKRPKNISVSRFIAEIGMLSVTPDLPARVVIDERTGTVVIGANVKISTVAATHGNLTIRITEVPSVSQPGPFSNGKTAVTPNTFVSGGEKGGSLAILEGTSLYELVSGLNSIGLKPKGVIAILQAIKTAGALQADLIVQ